MIREYDVKDEEYIMNIMRQGTKADAEDIYYILNNSDKIFVFEDSNVGILGFSTFRIWGKDRDKADVYVYVVPDSRRMGIGTLLYQEIMKSITKSDFRFFSTRIEIMKDDTSFFFMKSGYEKWYAEHVLYYHGLEQPKSDLIFIKYEDSYFEQYVEGLRTCFYELRKSNDFEPYYCCEPNDEKRKELLHNKENIFLFFDKEQLAASVSISDKGRIDDVFVLPSYQGKGYGKKIMQFAINKAIEHRNDCISLTAIDWNTRAINLYQSLGFEIEKTSHYYRLFID